MNTKKREHTDARAKIIFLAGCTALVGVIAFDALYRETSLFAEGWPNSSVDYIIRSIVISISTFAIVWGLTDGRRPVLVLDSGNGIPLERLSISAVLSVSAVFLCIFIFNPSYFNTLSMEDGLVEWASAVFLFGCCIIAAISTVTSRHTSGLPKGTELSLAIISLVFFVMAMEEISWFQRVFEIDTPAAFKGNYQNELNFHNFATNKVENIYYFGAFIFLVALPFFRLIFPFVSDNNYLRIFTARPFIGIIGSVGCAYNFDMWNIIFTQIAFFGSTAILSAFFAFSSNRRDSCIVLLAIFFMITTQLLFLSNGVNFAREWEVTEYKELFIPLALFIYSLDILIFIQRARLSEKADK